MSNTLPLPEPWDYCYEWNGPFGTRKFSAASYNGNRPDRSVPIYTADQMHAHAAAVSAAKDKEMAQLRAELIKSLADNAALRADAIDRQNNVVAPLRAEVAGLREFVEHVRRNGGTHLANMAIAVLAARKGEA